MSPSSALDPFAVKRWRKSSPLRLIWTAQSRLLQRLASINFKSNIAAVRAKPATHRFDDRGADIADTAVTSRQQELLLLAVRSRAGLPGDVAEIGSYRGVTTSALARATAKTIHAVDPFMEYGGSEADFEHFRAKTGALANVTHIRKTSGEAAMDFLDGSLSMVFIDGVHDFSNSWFDFVSWSRKVASGGLVALHDVDEHEGVTLTCSKIISDPAFSIFAYCPNLIIFEKREPIGARP
jgi:predicted O-methyltransferase YrrM